jgi:phosphoglycerate kinase
MKKTIDDIDVRGKRVLVRLDLDVPIGADGAIADDRRIRAALPTIQALIEQRGRLILMGHMGRPKDTPADRQKLSMRPVSKRLSDLLHKPVAILGDFTDPQDRMVAGSLNDGDVCLCENLRFWEGETIKDKEAAKDPTLRHKKDDFARHIAQLGDVYVNDAFGTCHRDNASMVTVPALMVGKPRVMGRHLTKELKFLGEAIASPQRPFVALLGGAKVSDKLGVIRSLLSKCDTILIGGAMAYTFLKADGKDVGRSKVEPDLLPTAKALLAEARHKLRLPVDSVCATEIAAGAAATVCEASIPPDRMGLDIGSRTISTYTDVIRTARTIVWNGPLGVFETPPFDKGTMAMAKAVAAATKAGAISIIGGGDSASAIDKAGLADSMTHISTGGGASLELLEGKRFAALDVLDDA